MLLFIYIFVYTYALKNIIVYHFLSRHASQSLIQLFPLDRELLHLGDRMREIRHG